MIRFACPGCNATYTVDDSKGGKAGKCPKCQAQFVIPDAEAGPPAVPAPPPAPRRAPPPPPADPDAPVEIKPCPKCGARLSVSAGDIGADVECPYCQEVYTARRPGAAPAPVERPSRRREEPPAPVERPSRRPAASDDDEDDRPRRRSRRDEDDEEDEDDRPRRRRGSRRGREDAEAAVAGPGMALLVLGVLGLLYALVNAVLLLTGNANNPFGPQPAGPNQAAPPGFMAGQYVGMGVTFVWGAIVLLGGIKLRGLSGGGPAKTGAIFAMLPCNPCCLAGIPVGIWALIVMNRPEVRRYMD